MLLFWPIVFKAFDQYINVINLGDFIINHHEGHEGFFLYLRSLRALRGKNIAVCVSEFS